MSRLIWMVPVVVALGLLSSVWTWGATPPEARDKVAAASVKYATTLSSSSGLVVDETLRPDYVRFSPGYVVAALRAGDAGERVVGTLQALLAAQDLTPRSPTYGLFLANVYAQTPSLEATSYLLPLLAWIHGHGQALPAELQEKVTQALEAAYGAVEKTKPTPEHPYLLLLRAAALATAGEALGHPAGLSTAQAQVSLWLRQQLSAGCWEGHGASAEALRLGALAWIAQAAGGQAGPDLERALRLGYADLAQRVQAGSGALAGAMAFVQPVDYIQGGDLNRCLLYLWGQGAEPPLLRPSAMYLAACDWVPPAALLDTTGVAGPRTVTTVAREGAPVTRTDTYLTDLFSLGTMTGTVGPRAVPLIITLAGGGNRPTAYLFTQPTPAAVAAVQQHGRAVVTVTFNQIGAADREQALLHGVLGPRADVTKVLINGEPWTGDAAALGMGTVVTWQRGEVYLGIRLGLCGPAQVSQRTERIKPGALQWQGDQPISELELLIYGRKQAYGLSPALDNVVVGVVTQVAAQADFPSLEAFSQVMMAQRLVQNAVASREKISPEEDLQTAFLNENKPHSRAQYRYVNHLVLDSLLKQGDEPLLHQQVDLATGRVLVTEVAGAAVTVTGPWTSPLLNLPWDQAAARDMLGAGQ